MHTEIIMLLILEFEAIENVVVPKVTESYLSLVSEAIESKRQRYFLFSWIKFTSISAKKLSQTFKHFLEGKHAHLTNLLPHSHLI